MILHGKTPRRLPPAGLLLIAAVGLTLLPLNPTRAEPKPPDTVEGLIAATKSCQACHAAPKAGGMGLHDDIVRMMDELRRTRKELADREAKLTEMLRRFEEQVAPKRADRERELREQLERLNKQLDEFRRKERKPAGAPAGKAADLTYFNLRSFQLPFHQAAAGAWRVDLYVSYDAGRAWTYVTSENPDKGAFKFHAKEDGPHWFAVVTDAGKPTTPDVHLVIDTVPPEVRFVAKVEDGSVLLSYDIRETNLSHRESRIEYRTEDGWKRLPSPLDHAREFRHHMANPPRHWRLRAVDLAGNETVVESK